MQKGQKVILLVLIYCVVSWMARGHRWAPAPLVAPVSIAQAVTPLRDQWSPPPRQGDDVLPAPRLAAPPTVKQVLDLPTSGLASARASAGRESPPPASWEGFLAKLRQLEGGERDKVRVIHLGDSELVGDGTSGSLRRELAARYGLGGLGFSLVALPLPWYLRDHWRHREGTGFMVSSYPRGTLVDGMYGPGGVAFDAAPGARAFVTMRHPVQGPCTVQFFFSHLPRGGSVKLYADGFEYMEADTKRPRAGLGMVQKKLATCPTELALSTRKRFTRLYGWAVEYDVPGIVWSGLGVVSAQLPQLAHYDTDHLHDALSALQPDLVVMTFGLNLAAAPYPPPPTYRDEVREVLAEVRKGTPNAACLVTGPYPVGHKPRKGGYHPKANSSKVINNFQRMAAETMGCVFLDRFRLSGGASAARRWMASRPKILGGDYQHLTVEGGNRMGRAIAGVIFASLDGDSTDHRTRFALERNRGGQRR